MRTCVDCGADLSADRPLVVRCVPCCYRRVPSVVDSGRLFSRAGQRTTMPPGVEALLGVMTDGQVAKLAGVRRNRVEAWRRRCGIPACPVEVSSAAQREGQRLGAARRWHKDGAAGGSP